MKILVASILLITFSCCIASDTLAQLHTSHAIIPGALQVDSASRQRSDAQLSANMRGLKFAGAVVAYGGGTFLVYRTMDTRIKDFTQGHKGSLASGVSKAVSDFGLGRSQAVGLVTTSIASVVLKNKALQSTCIIWLGSLLLNSSMTEFTKHTFQRHRANTGDPYNTFDWHRGPGVNRSFISAHTSNIFTTATVWSLQYDRKPWVAPVCYGLATLVGLSRVYDNAHWSSDVLAGAGVGYLSGRAMYWLYHKASKKIKSFRVLE